MRLLARFVCCVFLLSSAAVATADDDLTRRIAASEGWVQWQVPMTADAGESCCYEGRGGGRRGCDLDGRSWSVNDAVPTAATGARELAVYAHVKAGRVDSIRAFSASCPISSASAVTRLDGVAPAASVAWLAAQARRDQGRKKDDDEGIAAIAFHATPAAMTALREFAAAGEPHGRREAALFWMGQARGAEGVDAVERVAHEDADAKIRNHAVFVLSQAEKYDTYPRVLAIAGSDRSGEVRGQALFWLAQMEDGRAAADIVAALRRETEASVREQAVFALTQLPDGQGDKALIGLVRGDYPREVKQKALFWLGQSGSDTALAFLDETLH